MGTQRVHGLRAVATVIVAVLAFFLVGGIASAQTPVAADADVSIDLGTEDDGNTTVTTDDGVVIELAPAVSKEITPEEAAEAGQGAGVEPTSAAGVDDPASILWIALAAGVLLAGALGLARIGKGAEG